MIGGVIDALPPQRIPRGGPRLLLLSPLSRACTRRRCHREAPARGACTCTRARRAGLAYAGRVAVGVCCFSLSLSLLKIETPSSLREVPSAVRAPHGDFCRRCIARGHGEGRIAQRSSAAAYSAIQCAQQAHARIEWHSRSAIEPLAAPPLTPPRGRRNCVKWGMPPVVVQVCCGLMRRLLCQRARARWVPHVAVLQLTQTRPRHGRDLALKHECTCIPRPRPSGARCLLV